VSEELEAVVLQLRQMAEAERERGKECRAAAAAYDAAADMVAGAAV
jgi:hypothetical protein